MLWLALMQRGRSFKFYHFAMIKVSAEKRYSRGALWAKPGSNSSVLQEGRQFDFHVEYPVRREHCVRACVRVWACTGTCTLPLNWRGCKAAPCLHSTCLACVFAFVSLFSHERREYPHPPDAHHVWWWSALPRLKQDLFFFVLFWFGVSFPFFYRISCRVWTNSSGSSARSPQPNCFASH